MSDGRVGVRRRQSGRPACRCAVFSTDSEMNNSLGRVRRRIQQKERNRWGRSGGSADGSRPGQRRRFLTDRQTSELTFSPPTLPSSDQAWVRTDHVLADFAHRIPW